MSDPSVGAIWQDNARPYKGRRGRVVAVGDKITLDPVPGFCPCPAKQVRTNIRKDRFLARWFLVAQAGEMMSEPKIIKGPLEGDEWCALIQCPQCGLEAWIDRDQFEGAISIVCECGWHETHNLAEVA